jgi:hypothetical protein
MIEQVSFEQQTIDHGTFGGSTAMMLQIHRESNDVDIFLRDARYQAVVFSPGRVPEDRRP